MKYAFLLRKPVLILFPAFLIAAIWFTKDPGQPRPVQPGVAEASLSDTLPTLWASLQVDQLQGIRHITEAGPFVYYFEYETDHTQLINVINQLTFPVDSARADLQIRVADIEAQQHLQALLKEKEVMKYFTISNDEYLTLECIKGYEHHYLLLSNNSDRVIHLVECG